MPDHFEAWLQADCGQRGKVASHCGDVQEHLGKETDCTEKGKLMFGMTKCVGNMIKAFPEKLKSTDAAKMPAGIRLLNQGQGGNCQRKRALQWLPKVCFHVSA